MTLSTHFSTQELQPIRDGLRKYIRLLGMVHDSYQWRWIADEYDYKSALRSLNEAIQLSERMLGKRKYQGVDYDLAGEMRKDMMTFLLSGRDEMETVANRKRYQPLYYLIMEPVCNLFKKFDHATAIKLAPEITAELATWIDQCGDDYGTHDDAIVATAQVRAMIAAREEQRKQEQAAKRKPNRRRNAALMNMIPDESPVEDEQDEEVESPFDKLFA